MKNIIIFTTGSSGSSVLAGLIASQGFWLGEETKKLNFDTYENSELVDLNMEILRLAGIKRRDCNDIPPPSIESIKALKQSADRSIFEKFILKCDQNGPWLWKDPRLSYTIHFWDQFPEVLKSDFLFIDRDPYQSYSGLILSRKIPMRFKEQQIMNGNYRSSVDRFVNENQIRLFQCIFEELILDPSHFIKKINDEFDFNITMDQLKQTYKGRLFAKRYNYFSYLKAEIIYCLYRYIKNDYIRFPRN